MKNQQQNWFIPQTRGTVIKHSDSHKAVQKVITFKVYHSDITRAFQSFCHAWKPCWKHCPNVLSVPSSHCFECLQNETLTRTFSVLWESYTGLNQTNTANVPRLTFVLFFLWQNRFTQKSVWEMHRHDEKSICSTKHLVRSQILTATNMKLVVVWVVASCTLVDSKPKISLKRRSLATRLQDIKFQKIAISKNVCIFG
jgi:hypothetical protein